MIFRVLFAVAALALVGCGAGDFNWGKVKNIIEGSPIKLDAEYVILTPQQVDCGVQEDLWDAPARSGSFTVARLTQKGRDLKFADDVSIDEMSRPFAQVRGDFNTIVAEIVSDRDGPEKDTKLVEVRLGAVFQNTCFPNPLPVMGVRKGKFTQDYPPILFFRYDNGWQIDKVQH